MIYNFRVSTKLDFYKYLDSQLIDGSSELFLVTTADVSQSECWKTENTMK